MNIQALTDIWNQVVNSPTWVAIVLVLNVIAMLWAKARFMDNRWIPHVCVVVGAVFYYLIGPDVVIQHHPGVLKVILGSILGAGSWAGHGALMLFIKARFPWFMPVDPADKPADKPPSQPGDPVEKVDKAEPK